MKRFLLINILVLIAIFACKGITSQGTKGFTAELVHKVSPDSPEQVYNISVAFGKYKLNKSGNNTEYIIVNKIDSLSYDVNSSRRTYVEASINESSFDDPVLAWEKLMRLFDKKLEDEETVLGYDCARTIYSSKTKAMIADWYSDSLKFFVKRQFKAGNNVSTMYLRNIEFTLMSDSLFIPPANYTRSQSVINTDETQIANLRKKQSISGTYSDLSPMGKIFEDSTSILIKTDRALETRLRFDNYDNKPFRASIDVFMQGLKVEFKDPIVVELNKFKDKKDIDVPLKGDSIRINLTEGFGFIRLEQLPGDINASIKVQRLYLTENQEQIVIPTAGKGTRIEIVGDNLNKSDSRFDMIVKKEIEETNRYAVKKGESEILTFPEDSGVKQITIRMDKNSFAKLVIARGDLEKIENSQK